MSAAVLRVLSDSGMLELVDSLTVVGSVAVCAVIPTGVADIVEFKVDSDVLLVTELLLLGYGITGLGFCVESDFSCCVLKVGVIFVMEPVVDAGLK
jgi:hypothetical protein